MTPSQPAPLDIPGKRARGRRARLRATQHGSAARVQATRQRQTTHTRASGRRCGCRTTPKRARACPSPRKHTRAQATSHAWVALTLKPHGPSHACASPRPVPIPWPPQHTMPRAQHHDPQISLQHVGVPVAVAASWRAQTTHACGRAPARPSRARRRRDTTRGAGRSRPAPRHMNVALDTAAPSKRA
jgi:hypothetical protein